MKRFLDWRIWLALYVVSTVLYLSRLGIVLRDLGVFLPGWSSYLFLVVSVVAIAIEAAVTPYTICVSPIAVIVVVASYRYYGFLASIPFIALAVSATIPFAEAYARLRSRGVSMATARHRRALYLGDAVLLTLFAVDLVLGVAVIALSEEWFTKLSGIAVAIYGACGTGIALYDVFRVYVATRIEPYSVRWFVAIWFRNAILRLVLESYAARLRNLIERAGVTEAPIVLAAKILTASLMLLAISPATLLLQMFLSPELAILAFTTTILTSIAIPTVPFLWLHSKVGDRKRQVEDELPWFVLYSAILQRVGIPLHEAFKRLIGKSILPATEREAKVLNKYVNLLGYDAITALEEIALRHPSREFRNLVFGYTSILRTGGDLATYLESKLNEQLRLLTIRLRRFADVALGTGEILLLFYLIFASVLAVAGSAAADIAQMFTFIGAPAIATSLIGYIYAIQPRTVFRYFIETNHVIPAAATAMVAVLALVGGLRGWLSLSIAFLAIGLGYGVQYSYGLARARTLEKQLIDFLRDLVEFRKIGIPPAQAIQRIARSRSYGEPLDSIVRAIAHQLSLSIPLAEAIERIELPSWLTRFVFFVLGEVEASGGGSVRVLEMLVNFIEEYWLARKEAGMKLRVYELFIALTPIILGVIVSASIGMAKALSTQMSARIASRSPIPFWIPSPAEAESMKLLVVGSTASMAIVASKAIDGSIRSLLRLAIAAALLTVYGLWLDPYVQNLVVTMLTASHISGS